MLIMKQFFLLEKQFLLDIRKSSTLNKFFSTNTNKFIQGRTFFYTEQELLFKQEQLFHN